MAQRLSEQVVEWLTVGGDAFTPQNFNSTNGNVTLAVSAPGETISIPATSGGPIGIYNNKGQLWTLGAAGATSSVKSSQLIVSSSDAAAGTGAALELWRGTDVSWQLRADNSTDELIIANNWTTAAQTSYTSNVSFGYGTVANQYVHIYSTLDSNYSYGGASGSALSVAGGITAAKKIYFSDTTDSNYATKAGALVVEGGVNIAKKVYLRDTTDSNYATVAGSFVTMGGAYIKKKTYIADTTDSNYSTKAGALVIEGGAYIGKKVYLKDTTDSSSTSTGALVVSGGVGIAKKLYVGSDFTQTGDTALIQSNVIRLRNKSANNNQAGTYPYITSLSIGDSTEITLDEYKDGYLSIHGKSGILLYPQTSQPAVYDVTNTYSVGTVVWYNKEYYRCTTAITEAQAWTAANWTKLPTASGSTWSHGNIYPTITNNYALGSSSYRWKSLEIGTASSYGSGTQPIYWSSGVPTASTSTVGSGVKPIYLSSGTITVSSSTVGTATKPVYLSSGTITVGTYELKATVNYEVNAKINSGTANQVAYYSGANEISSKAPAWSAWTAGTTAGPKANIQIGNATYTSNAIPSASSSASGIVTTGTQGFAGEKTFNAAVTITAASAANTALLNILTTRTPSAGEFDWGVKHLVSNMAANTNTSGIVTGKAGSAGNSAYFGFHYEGSNSASNYISIGMYGFNHILTINKNGDVTINSQGTNRARLYINTTSDNPNDLYFKTNNTNQWSLSARGSSDSYYFGLYKFSTDGWHTKWTKDGNMEIMDGLLKITANSNTVTIGSQNNGWCHIYNSANIPFIFNKTVATSSGGLGTSAYPWNDFYINATSGGSDFTDGTEILCSYASDNGFEDTNGKYKVYRRTASKLLNYLNTKGTYLRYFSASNTSAAASGANDQQAMRQITAIQGLFHNNSRPEGITLTSGNSAVAFGYIISGTSYNTTSTAYGGYFIAHYNTPKYLGISGGSWQMHTLVKGHSSGYYGSGNPPSSAFTGDVYFKTV